MTKRTSKTKYCFIRSRMFVCLLLLSAFLPVAHTHASETADSVYFHAELDTVGGLRVGRVLRLTYALVNSRFDTASYPVFNDSIKVLNGPKPHKRESCSIINGVKSNSYETGFYYLVQFKNSGEARIPVASVTADGKTYTTPEYRVSVHPAEVDMSKLECHLEVEQLKSDYVKYRAILTCNARPDQNPPLLTINGKTVPPNSNSYSSSKNKEEYTYTYYFTSEGYDVSCEELTFGGVPYSIKPRESKLDEADYIVAILIIGALFELIWWLAYRIRYREEKNAPLAAFVLEKKTLPLIISWAYTHYGASHMLMLYAAMFISISGVMHY